MIEPGMHLNAVGGDCPGKTELHADVLRMAAVPAVPCAACSPVSTSRDANACERPASNTALNPVMNASGTRNRDAARANALKMP